MDMHAARPAVSYSAHVNSLHVRDSMYSAAASRFHLVSQASIAFRALRSLTRSSTIIFHRVSFPGPSRCVTLLFVLLYYIYHDTSPLPTLANVSLQLSY
jgi:hypothetical protein